MYRYMTSTTLRAFLRAWYVAGFRYTFFMRSCKYFASKGFFGKGIFMICRVALRHYSVKYGFQIPWQTNIGPGLAIGHYGPIIVNPNSSIGANCNITVGVLLGLSARTDSDGRNIGFDYPVVGNRVALNNSSKILGGVNISSAAVVGVSSVVTKDVPRNAVVVGAPAKIISDKGSSAYVGSCHPWTKQFEDEEENTFHYK